jgi:hypothetical protein
VPTDGGSAGVVLPPRRVDAVVRFVILSVVLPVCGGVAGLVCSPLRGDTEMERCCGAAAGLLFGVAIGLR